MDDFDDAMLSLALRDAFPTVIFAEGGLSLTEPRLELRNSIPECGASSVDIWVPDEGWEPEFVVDEEHPQWYLFPNSPRFHFWYRRSEWFWGVRYQPKKYAFSLPTLESGEISSPLEPWDKEKQKFLRKAWSVMKKLMTNRIKLGIDKDVVINMDAGPQGHDDEWVGNYALEWCQQDPTRMINGARLPRDDYESPNTPWHQDLRRQVIEQFGPDFGGPPEPPAWY